VPGEQLAEAGILRVLHGSRYQVKGYPRGRKFPIVSVAHSAPGYPSPPYGPFAPWRVPSRALRHRSVTRCWRPRLAGRCRGGRGCRRRARSSKGVGCAFSTTSRAPRCRAISGRAAAGYTVSDVPIARKRSAPSARLGALEILGDEVLAERDRRRLQDPAAVRARRVVLTSADASSATSIGAPPSAREALDLAHVAVDLMIRSGELPASWCSRSTLLRDQRVERGLLLEPGQRAMPVVGSAEEEVALEPVAPRLLSDLGIGHVVLQRPRSSRPRGSFVQTPCGPRKSGYRIRSEIAGAGQDDDLTASRSQPANRGDVVSHALILHRCGRRRVQRRHGAGAPTAPRRGRSPDGSRC